jgi:short-subunit dehydrogenase
MTFRRNASYRRVHDQKQFVVVTGASSGIGEASLKLFAKNGFKVVGLARRGHRLEKITRILKGLGFECFWYESDLADYQSTIEVSEQILKDHGCPDGIIFNAGCSSNKAFSENLPDDRLSEMNLNYLSPTWMLDVFLPVAKKRGSGHFLAIGSLSAATSFPGNATYAASKAALAALWQSLEHEYTRSGLAFSTILPGIVETEMTKEIQTWIPRRSAESVAELVFQTFQKPEMLKTHGLENQAILTLTRVFPETTQNLISHLQTLIIPKRQKP